MASHRRLSAMALGCVLVCAACGGDDDDGNDENPYGNAGFGGSAGASGSSGSGSGASNGGGGNGGGGDLAGMAVCKHVDLVIAVDGSSSMTEELQAMRTTVFPAFAERLRELGAELDDFRVATLDACPTPANFHTRGAQGECNFSGGQAWIDSSSAAMDAEFACVGDIFLSDQECSGENDDEQPATSIVTALENGNNGFRRDDALLIALAITDEDEQPTGGSREMEDIYDRFAALVNDDPRRMVFVGAAGREQCQGTYGDAEEAEDMQDLVGLFADHDRGVFWDLCEGRLEDGLSEAFRVIENACNELCGDLDEDCGGTPPPGNPTFCDEFPDDPSCRPD